MQNLLLLQNVNGFNDNKMVPQIQKEIFNQSAI